VPLVYATTADLRTYGLPATALGRVSDADQVAALAAAQSTLDTYFNGRYALPLLAIDAEVTKRTCHIAAYELMAGPRGYNPAAGADETLRMRYEDAIRWAEGVQAKRVHPQVTPAANQSPAYDMPIVITSSVVNQNGGVATRRGW